MTRYRFTGEAPETFPSIVITELDDDGTPVHRTLVCEPGDEIELDDDIEHPRLVPVGKPAKRAAKKRAAGKRAAKAVEPESPAGDTEPAGDAGDSEES